MKYLSTKTSDNLDKVLTHKFWGVFFFIFIMWFMFYCTFTIGEFPKGWIEDGVLALSIWAKAQFADGPLRDLLLDGVINGVGSVIVFLPNILILFLFIALLEGSGYMNRASMVMDKYMQKIGLHGKSFLSLIMGFGCNVPAIMATNTIPNRKRRLLTILINPFMSCSARLPVYILIIGAFFPERPVLVLAFVYVLGIILAIISSLVLKKFVPEDEVQKLNMQHKLPPYTIPTLKSTMMFMLEKASQYLKKIGGVVLVSVVIIWALNYFPRDKYVEKYNVEASKIEQTHIGTEEQKEEALLDLKLVINAEQQSNSFLGKIGHFVEPVMRPLGFDWKMSIALVAGLPAKEFIVSTLGVIYQVEDPLEESSALISRLRNEVYTSGPKIGQPTFNKAVALSFLVFVLLYFPCVATVATIRKEAGGWSWAIFSIFFTTGMAWIVSFIVYRIALLF